MQVTTPMTDVLSKYLDLASSEIKVTAGNMANVDTPGYRAKGFDFAAEMRGAIAQTLNARSSDAPTGVATPKIFEVDGLLERPDGNDVSMDREGLNLAEAQLKFRTGVELMKREMSQVMDAIHSDTK